MLEPWLIRLVTAYAVLKGVAIAVVVAALDIAFWKAIVIAIISGTIGAIGAIGAALVSARAARENRELLHDVKRSIGADRRRDDQ